MNNLSVHLHVLKFSASTCLTFLPASPLDSDRWLDAGVSDGIVKLYDAKNIGWLNLFGAHLCGSNGLRYFAACDGCTTVFSYEQQDDCIC